MTLGLCLDRGQDVTNKFTAQSGERKKPSFSCPFRFHIDPFPIQNTMNPMLQYRL